MKVLITGGDTGLGLKIAQKLCNDELLILETDKLIGAIKKNMLKVYIDCCLYDYKPDIIINNFGINHLSWIGETQEFDSRILEANVMTPYWVVNKIVSNGGVCKVVNISSMTYKVPQRTTALYCASKAAIVQMTKVMARELAPKGWVVNCFAPGKITGTLMTELTDSQVNNLRGWTQQEADEYATGLVPMGRFMDTDEAACIVFSILDMKDYVNGTVIEAFGGL